MAIVDEALLQMSGDIKNAQAIKDMVINQLFEDDFISADERDRYMMKFQVIIIKKSWWNNWRKIFGEDSSSGYHYRLVKIN